WIISSVTGITAQGFTGVVETFPSPVKLFERQLDLSAHYPLAAVKIGALFSMDQLEAVIRYCRSLKNTVIVADPVFGPSGGAPFYTEEMVRCFTEDLVRHVSVVTPNRTELERVYGRAFNTVIEAAEHVHAARDSNTVYCIKGGHFDGATITEAVVDRSIHYTRSKRRQYKYSHGTGCMLSTLVACHAGGGMKIDRAFRKATKAVQDRYNLYNSI
ncbi:MAG: bifunctional hydroxymethylpyrimidine kinase/phosphomethylpyrimidine kinase, partial [Spirochaetota bacterium]